MNECVFIGKPNKHSIISIGQNWLAITPDGHTLFLTDGQEFKKYFHFDIQLIKLIFSPKGQMLYCINKNFQIYQIVTTLKKLSSTTEFDLLIELEPSTFIHVIPFNKILYIIQDTHIHQIKDHEIIASHEIESPITTVSPILKETAISHNLIDSSNPLPYVVLAGDVRGNVFRIAFPKTLIPLPQYSQPFISHSDPISIITSQNNIIMFCGKFGTFYSTEKIEKCLPHPVKSIHLIDSASGFLFVSDRRLYVASLKNASSFQVVSSFPAKIAASIDAYALLESGYLANIGSKSTSCLDPKNRFIEYALERLCDISQESLKLTQEISKAGAVLNGLQFIRALKSRNEILTSSIKLCPTVFPDGQIHVSVEVKINPKDGYSCKGVSLLLRIKKEIGISEPNTMISLSKVETNSVFWTKEIQLVDPTPIVVELLMFYDSNDAILIQSSTFDILDFSVEIPPNQANVGKLSPMHSIRHQKPSTQINFAVITRSDQFPKSQFFKQTHAFIAPYGEHFTVRFESNTCNVNAGTESTKIAVRAAILKKACLDSDENEIQETTETLCNDIFSDLQNRCFAVSGFLENELIPIANATQKVMELQSLTDQWIESVI